MSVKRASETQRAWADFPCIHFEFDGKDKTGDALGFTNNDWDLEHKRNMAHTDANGKNIDVLDRWPSTKDEIKVEKNGIRLTYKQFNLTQHQGDTHFKITIKEDVGTDDVISFTF